MKEFQLLKAILTDRNLKKLKPSLIGSSLSFTHECKNIF